MSGEYQLRRDVDKIIDDIYDIDYNTLKLVRFNENSPLRNIGVHVDDKGNYIDVGTIDTILEALGLMDIEERFRKLVLEDLLDKTYPIGSIYISVNSTSPSILFGGTWVQLQDTFLYATSTTADDNVTTAPTGQGEATHTLTTDEMPSHNHSAGGGNVLAYNVTSGTEDTTAGFQSGNLWDTIRKKSVGIDKTGGDVNGDTVPHNNMPPYLKVYMWKRVASTYDGISLSSDKNILSYADEESATLTAQLTNNGSSASVSGVTVEFYKDSTSLGTATTDSNGVATMTYVSDGSGDISLTAEADNYTSSPITIEDCWLYDDASTDKLSNYVITSNLTATYNTDHYTLTSGAVNQFLSVYNGKDKVRFEVELKPTSSSTDGTGINVADTGNNFNTSAFLQNASNFGVVFHTNGSWSAGTRQTSPLPNYANYNRYYFEINGSSIKAVCEDLQGNGIYTYSFTKSISNKYLNIVLSSNSRTLNINKIKVKAL